MLHDKSLLEKYFIINEILHSKLLLEKYFTVNKILHSKTLLESFLQLKHEIKKTHFYFNRTKGFHCLKRAGRCLAKSKGRQHPNVSSEILHKLRTFFRPYNFQFYDIIGQDFGWPEE